MEDHDRAGIYLQSHSTAKGQVLKKAAAHRQPVLEQAPGRCCSLWTDAHVGAHFLAAPVFSGGFILQPSICEGLYPMERTHAGAGEENEEEGTIETSVRD